MELREAWTSVVAAADLDRHMADNGQAAANAGLLDRLLTAMELPAGAQVLMPGAGTGQFLDYTSPGSRRLGWVFTDLNPTFLTLLQDRLRRHPALDAEVRPDDAERPTVPGPFEAVVAVLLLEHIDWQGAIAAWTRLAPRWIALIIQRNEAEAMLLTARRVLTPTMARFREVARPHLIPEAALTAELARRGYPSHWRMEQPVPDDKTMIALLYRAEGR